MNNFWEKYLLFHTYALISIITLIFVLGKADKEKKSFKWMYLAMSVFWWIYLPFIGYEKIKNYLILQKNLNLSDYDKYDQELKNKFLNQRYESNFKYDTDENFRKQVNATAFILFVTHQHHFEDFDDIIDESEYAELTQVEIEDRINNAFDVQDYKTIVVLSKYLNDRNKNGNNRRLTQRNNSAHLE